MVIKQEKSTALKTGEKYSSIFEPVDKVNMQDEMELIKSKEFLIQTVHNLGLNNNYIEHGSIRSSEVYKFVPYMIEPVKVSDSSRSYKFDVQFLSAKTFLLNKETKPRLIYSNIDIEGSIFRLMTLSAVESEFQNRNFTYKWLPSKIVAGQIASGLTITPVGKSSSVLNFSFQTFNTDKGVDILNQIMKDYEKYSMSEKAGYPRIPCNLSMPGSMG